MEWIRYDMHTTTKDADALGEILTECGISGYEVTDHVPLSQKEEAMMYTDIPADLGPDDGTAVLTFYTEAPDTDGKDRGFFSTGSSLRDETLGADAPPPDPEELIAQILAKIRQAQEFWPIALPRITYCVQDDSLWKDNWKQNFQTFYAAEDILIKPAWEETPAFAKPEDIVIEIEPGSAFGTGTHETTKLCLLALRKYIRPDASILDAGCGSGILAIAALLCGARSAVCLDIDPSAVRGTQENAARNHIDSGRLTAIHANILKDSDAVYRQSGGNFQIAVANILADVIIPLSACIGRFLEEGGIFISSGILAQKASEVEEALSANGFTILEKNTMGEWVSFAAQKGLSR